MRERNTHLILKNELFLDVLTCTKYDYSFAVALDSLHILWANDTAIKTYKINFESFHLSKIENLNYLYKAVQEFLVRDSSKGSLNSNIAGTKKITFYLQEIEKKEVLLCTIKDDYFNIENIIDINTILQNTLDVVLKIENSGKILYISESCNQALGYSQVEVIGKSILDYCHPNDSRKLMKYIDYQALDDDFSHQEIRLKLKSGSFAWFETKNKVITKSENNSTFSIVAIARNITEKKLEEEILNSRLKLREYSDKHSLSSLLRKTLDEAEKLTESKIGFYHFMDPNQKTIKLQEWSTNTIKYFCERKFDNHAYSIDEAGIWAQSFYTKEPIIHNNYSLAAGKKGLPEGHAKLDRELIVPVIRENKVVALVGVGNKETDYNENDVKIVSLFADLAWDIAERKIATQNLQEKEEKLRSIISIAPVGIGTVVNRVIHDVNDTFCILMGYSKDELINQSSVMLYPSIEEYNLVGENKYKSIYKQGFGTVETKFKRKDGKIIEVILSSIALDVNDLEKGVVFTVLDITEKNETLKKLKKALHEVTVSNNEIQKNLVEKNELIQLLAASEEKLKKANAEKDKFFSVVAHDLRSPFHGLLGISQILYENLEILSEVEIKDLIKEMFNSTKSMNNLLENLLEWSRIKRGVTNYNFLKLNLFEVAKEIVFLFTNNSEQKKIKLINSIPNNYDVYADMHLLSSVLRNLVSNAIKFTNIGGIIEIKAEPNNKPDEIIVSVIDNGIGCNENELKNLFKIDKKVSKKGTLDESGSGLGLILCKEYVEKLGGKIWVESEPKKGSTFNFTMQLINQ